VNITCDGEARQTFEQFDLLMHEDLIDLRQVLEPLRHAGNACRSCHELRASSPTCRHAVHAQKYLSHV